MSCTSEYIRDYHRILFKTSPRTPLTHARSLAHPLPSPPLSDTKRCDIIQLAAISGDLTFNMYMMPQVAIDRGATAVTGFRVHNGKLFQNGRAMNTAILHEALASFLDFLWSLEKPVLLAVHNASIEKCLTLLHNN
jgi:hypothetical protein